MFTTWNNKFSKQKDYGGKEKNGTLNVHCGDGNNLTIDHVYQGQRKWTDFTKNVVCCCSDCNQRKGHEPWEEWFLKQGIFRGEIPKIREWMEPDPPKAYSNIVQKE